MSTQEEKSLASRILELSEHALYVFAKDDFQILYANAKAKEIFGEELLDSTCYNGIAGRPLPCFDCPFCNLNHGKGCVSERYFEGLDRRVKVRADEITWLDGKNAVLVKFLESETLLAAKHQQDVIMKEMYAERLRLNGELYQAVVNQLKTIVFEYNYERKSSYTSSLFKEKFGVDRISGMNFLEDSVTRKLIYEEDEELYATLFHDRDDDFREINCRLVEASGKTVWYKVCIQFIREGNTGRLIRAIGTLKDIDDVTRSNETLRYQSEYDTLTNIWNVNRFYTNAASQILQDLDKKYAIISFDIDKFKMINDLFGMLTGDDVLCHIANVLRDTLPEDALYCRVHSDMFLICISYEKRGDLICMIEKLRKGIFKNGFSFDINTSFGIYLVGDPQIPINLMCDRASLAARTVKDNVMNFCAFYDEQYRDEIVKTTEIEQDMNQALLDNQFVMYLQPKYTLENGKICGAEVLARWKHPIKGLIPPNDFIPLFERNGFILKLDEYMWEQACKTLAQWREEGKEPVPLSVNISRYHIKHNDLVGVWKRLIRKYNVPTSDLTLELTETFFYDSEDLYEVLKQLQDMGFSLEVDDFGAGYSSLNLIRNIPVNTIKIDKDFLDQRLTTEKGKIVIGHTIAMAKDLKLKVIAEGVETQEHVEFLKSSSCDVAQGYFFAKPMPLDEFNRLMFGE